MKKILYLFIVGIGTFGCSNDMLDITDPGNFTPESFYKNQSEMDAAVIGAYGRLRSLFATNAIYFWGEIRSDNTGFFSPNVAKQRVDYFVPLPEDESAVQIMWDGGYGVIIAANAVLEKVDGATYFNEDIKKQHIGEASLIRALVYFYLARLFGGYALDGQPLGVPKVISHVGINDAREMPRASLEEIYALIVEDLTVAKDNLPSTVSGSDTGRFTSVSAQALLGKVYMFMAGYPLNKGTEYYTKAVTELKPVAENSALSLVPSYIQLFNADNKNTSESIIEIQFLSDLAKGTGNLFQMRMLTSNAARALVPAGDAGQADNRPTLSVLSAFAPGDPRKSVTFRPGYKEAGGSYIYEPYGHKYWQPFGKDQADVDSYLNWTCNWKELRLADVYLLYAEALVRSGGDKGTALLYVNKIRERARNTNKSEDPTILTIEAQYPTWNEGDPAVSLRDYVVGDFASDSELLLAIENESRVEFALENRRWYYLVRTERAPEVITAQLAADENVNIIWNDRDYAIPIPRNAMETAAPGVIIQNVGYNQY